MDSARESLRDAKTAMVEVFRNRNLRRLNLAFAGSVVGDWAEGVLVQLARRSRPASATAGDVVLREGEPGDLFYVIESGEVDVTIRGEHIR